MQIEEQIFKLIDADQTIGGEQLTIEGGEDASGNTYYRLYHREGYCLDVSKVYEEEGEEWTFTVLNRHQSEGFAIATKEQVLGWLLKK